MSNATLYNADCFDIFPQIADRSIDCIICDLPYGRTQNKWDSVLPFDALWAEYKRIVKENGAILLFADGLFMADLMLSNKKMWRYNLVWDKILTSGFLNANRQPLRVHEEIVVFYKKQPTYNPQKTKGTPCHSKGKVKQSKNNNYGTYGFVDNSKELGEMKHPKSIVRVSKVHPSQSVHPTQKPIELLEWLIRTYTKEEDTVLDNCMGSGSTGVACKNLNRNFIGIEISAEYYALACQRLNMQKFCTLE